MTDKSSILVCGTATDACWQLGQLPPTVGSVTLVGWQLPVVPVDSGVPPDIALVLARALTSVAWVTFPVAPSSENAIRRSHNQTQIRSVAPENLGECTSALLKREPLTVELVSTRDPGVAACLFDDPGYPWWLQGQVALLSDPDSEPQLVERKVLLSALTGEWEKHAGHLRAAGIWGLLRPGVDGDVAAVFALAGDAGQALVDGLREKATAAGFDCLLLSESEFKRMLG
jgi:hypothetical protein